MADDTLQRGRIWGLVLAIFAEIPVCIVIVLPVILLARLLGVTNKEVVGIAAVVSQFLFGVLFIWLVLYFTFIRTRAPRRGLAYFVVLLIVAIALDAGLGSLGYFGSQRQAAINATRSAADIRTALSEAAGAETAVISGHFNFVDLHTQAPGAAGLIARAAKTLVQSVSNARSTFDQEIVELGYPDLMSPIRLGADPGFVKTSLALREVRKAIEDRKQKTDAAMAAYRAQLAGARIDETLKREALNQFDRRMVASNASSALETSLQLKTVDEMEQAIRELKAEKGEWKISGETIVFTDAHALRLYRGHRDNFLAIGHQLANLAK
ncbi:MAG: hypothetical protein ABSC92_17105 [Rhizomicrobium sp.]|jgi:hypothetical protein